MNGRTWNPGDEDGTDEPNVGDESKDRDGDRGEGSDEGRDEEVKDGGEKTGADTETVVRRRGKTRIEATRSQERSRGSGHRFVVRRGKFETETVDEEG
ncbi:MAG: hypothetical protein ACI9QA_000372 [Methanobacteriota archaeon]|jgi:hypothetical protein